MNDRMKEMYKSGGLLKALLKDPSQRKMAADMLASNSDSVIDGNAGRGGTKKYVAGGSVEERIKTMLGAPAGFNPGAKDQYAMGGVMKYRMGGNMPGEDEETIMLDEVTVVDKEPSGFKSRLFMAEGVSKDDYMRERSNLGRELADNLVGGGKPVSDKVVRALLGEEVQLSDLEAKELGYLRDKGASSMLTDMQLERGLLEQGYIDKQTRERVSPDMMTEAQRRGLGLKGDRPGLNATYRYQ
jgi:hypothetical protein